MESLPLRNFIESFFVHYGAAIATEGKVLDVALPEDGSASDVVRFLGRERFRLVFDVEDLTDDSELVAVGSFLINRIREFMASQGRKAHVVLPVSHKVNKSDIASRLQPLNASLESVSAEKTERREVIFVFQISYLCDEKREELHALAVDGQTKATRTVKDEELTLTPQGKDKLRDTFPEEEMLGLFNLAAMEASKHARTASQDLEHDIVERLHKSIERIDAYYQQLIADLPNPESEEFDRRAAEYEKEHALKRQETLENHALEIRVSLVQYLILERPVRRFLFHLAARDGNGEVTAEATVPLNVDLCDGRQFRPQCGACDGVLEQVALCRSGHAVCPSCLWQCACCEKPICPKCVSDKCRLCGKRLCEDCLHKCATCGEPVCESETAPCKVCGDPVCRECRGHCLDCGGIACADHQRACSISDSAVCSDCAISCTHCDGEAARSNTRKCHTCGQVFCAECLQLCVVCEKEFCPAHAGEITDRRMCPQCVLKSD